MATQIQITLYGEAAASHAEIVALLTKVYDFATDEVTRSEVKPRLSIHRIKSEV